MTQIELTNNQIIVLEHTSRFERILECELWDEWETVLNELCDLGLVACMSGAAFHDKKSYMITYTGLKRLEDQDNATD
jgi:hypothetical protein